MLGDYNFHGLIWSHRSCDVKSYCASPLESLRENFKTFWPKSGTCTFY